MFSSYRSTGATMRTTLLVAASRCRGSDSGFAPAGRWHDVETVSALALSVNYWADHPTDPRDRLKEAVVRLVAQGLKHASGASASAEAEAEDDSPAWLNPGATVAPVVRAQATP